MPFKKTGHTTFYRGKRVHVILMDGTKFVDKYVESNDKAVTFKEHGKIMKTDLRVIGYYKGETK